MDLNKCCLSFFFTNSASVNDKFHASTSVLPLYYIWYKLNIINKKILHAHCDCFGQNCFPYC